MRNSGSLSALLVSAALTLAPVTASADPASPATPVEPTTPAGATIAPEPAPAPPDTASDSEQYASREAGDQSVAEFQGGDTVVIAGSTLAIVLLIVLLVILL